MAALALIAVAPVPAETAAALVSALVDALNRQDAEALVRVYAGYFPWSLCNAFEAMLAAAMAPSFARVYDVRAVLGELRESRAAVTVAPRIVPTTSPSGRVSVVFGLWWGYATARGEWEELSLIVSWEIKAFEDGWRVVHQVTRPCGG